MRSESDYQSATKLLEMGWTDSDIARVTKIPRTTIRDWRHAIEAGASDRTASSVSQTSICPRCDLPTLAEAQYSYLLGLYLGDGCLSRQGVSSWKLRIVQDSKYPNLIRLCGTSMATVRQVQNVNYLRRGGHVEISSSWSHWQCLFPQHAPGPKNRRRIALEEWQLQIVHREREQLVRGLIHSDGSRYVNKVVRDVSGRPKPYQYVSYSFTNTSADILDILENSLAELGVGCRRYDRAIAIRKRPDVAELDRFIGPKS